MPEDRSDIYLDLSFFEDEDTSEDTRIDLQFFEPDNIGQRTVRVELELPESAEAGEDVDLKYVTAAAIDYATNVSLEYETVAGHIADRTDTEVNFRLDEEQYGTIDLSHYYRFFNTVSGAIDVDINLIGGREYSGFIATLVDFTYPTYNSGIIEFLNNYTNFSGDYTPSNDPLPYHEKEFDIRASTEIKYTTTSGGIDTWHELFFAGYIFFEHEMDVYSVDERLYTGPTYEVTSISGALDVHYLDVFSTIVTVSGVTTDVYCALTDFAYQDCEVETRKGRNAFKTTDVFSTIELEPGVTFDVSLYSLKITNFSLDEGESTTADGFISVDIEDDECPVSTSGTVLLVDGAQVPTTLSGITNGYRLYYDPADDFESLSGPTTFTVHAENECGDILEKDYYLTFGYIVEYDNKGLDYGYYSQVAVRVTAENMASCPKENSVAYIFETEDYIQKDLGASIVGKPLSHEDEDLSASIYPQSTAYFYGKDFEVVVNAKDFAGREMETFILRYKIEDDPDQ